MNNIYIKSESVDTNDNDNDSSIFTRAFYVTRLLNRNTSRDNLHFTTSTKMNNKIALIYVNVDLVSNITITTKKQLDENITMIFAVFLTEALFVIKLNQVKMSSVYCITLYNLWISQWVSKLNGLTKIFITKCISW